MREKQVFIFLVLVCTGLIFAAVGAEVRDAVSSLCSGIQGMLPVAAMLMIVLGAVIYASGQLMGAETRARANVWATASLTGALFGILIVAVSQPVLNALYPGISCAGMQQCNGQEYDPGTQGCCNNRIYTLASQVCCNNQIRNGVLCCGNGACTADQICQQDVCRVPNCGANLWCGGATPKCCNNPNNCVGRDQACPNN